MIHTLFNENTLKLYAELEYKYDAVLPSAVLGQSTHHLIVDKLYIYYSTVVHDMI